MTISTQQRGERYHTRDIAVPGGDLRVGIWEPVGELEGTILAVHGITASHLSWQWLAATLPNWRVIGPDLRGRGRSNDLPGPYGLVTHAHDVVAVLEELVEGPIPVLGHSMGGFVAVRVAHHRPDLVSRLVLVDGGLPLQIPDGVRPEDAAQAVLGPAAQRLSMEFPDVDTYQEFFRQHPGLADAWGPQLAAYVAYDLDGEPPHLKPATRFEAMAEDSLDLQVTEGQVEALVNLQCPTVFLRAERGLLNEPAAFYSPAWVAQWAEQLPNFRTVEIDDINHYTIVMTDPGINRVVTFVT